MPTTAVARRTPAQKDKTIADLRQDNKELRSELKDVVADGNRRINAFIKTELPQIALYAGGGAAVGVLLGYFLFDRFQEWFTPGSYLALLSTAAVGVVVIVATPSVVRVTKKSITDQGPLQAALYGLGAGLVASGAYRAYQAWPQA